MEGFFQFFCLLMGSSLPLVTRAFLISSPLFFIQENPNPDWLCVYPSIQQTPLSPSLTPFSYISNLQFSSMRCSWSIEQNKNAVVHSKRSITAPFFITILQCPATGQYI
ncbi:hypothetical protein O6H91_16G054300 [Diphasiastrum complanatum]|uniref:Uncharacterized protein n=1 Tax=Diphasiastrum complanatum TaxID=34168 RepID=A0ACC2BCJ2_DIPCM|nr:hypothetical protein O6H91_16G054300 [Diphasiastrum complanatum]